MKATLLLLVSLLGGGCFYSMYGYRHRVTYTALDPGARAALVRKVEVEQVLADIPGAGLRKRAESDEITLYGESKSMTSPEFGESRRRIERALGPELLRQLKVSRDWHPIP